MVSCVYNFLVVSFLALRFIIFWALMLDYVSIFFVLHKTFGVLCSRAQGPLLLMKQTF